MFFVVPTGTDAPIYHWPFATIGLIVANIVVMVLQFAIPEINEIGALQYGTINPLTWVSCIFMHVGVGHLIGNIVGLGLAGWIVEGKIGWWRFLCIYLFCGIFVSSLIQIVMLFVADEGGAMGASGAIFGMLAIAMIWAPENEVRMFYFVLIFFYPYMGVFELTVSTLGFILIGKEFLMAAFTLFKMSSAIAHLLGALPGLVIGLMMIKLRWVDCDGFDLISIMQGKRGERVLTVADEKKQQQRKAQQAQEAKARFQEGLAMVDKYVRDGNYEMALNRFSILQRANPKLVMPEAQLVTIINGFDADPAKRLKAVPLIQQYLQQYSLHKVHFTLMLARAHILLQQRPRLGLNVLKTLDLPKLTPEETSFVKRLADKAKAMIAEGILEFNE